MTVRIIGRRVSRTRGREEAGIPRLYGDAVGVMKDHDHDLTAGKLVPEKGELASDGLIHDTHVKLLL